MKKLLLIFAAGILIFTSCEKCDQHHNCPVVSTTQVPLPVKDAQASRYANSTVDSWYNTDNTGYCAKFMNNGKSTLAYYEKDGTLVKERAQGEKDCGHKDNDKDCECGDNTEQHGDH